MSEHRMRVGPPAAGDDAAAQHPAEGRKAALMASLRDCLDKVARSDPDDETLRTLADGLQSWSHGLSSRGPAKRPLLALDVELEDRLRALAPSFTVVHQGERTLSGVFTFERDHTGGGWVALIFLHVLGNMANSGGRPPARTAYLHTDFRAGTPLERELTMTARFISETGRKRLLRGEVRHGDTLCAEAEALFIVPRAEPA